MTARVNVAIDVPLRRLFQYDSEQVLAPGTRVRVPFGSSSKVGVVVDMPVHRPIAGKRIKSVESILDDAPLLSQELLRLLSWAARYYQHPTGEVIATALPPALRKGRPLAAPPRTWELTPQGRAVDIEALRRRAPRQADMLSLLRDPAAAAGLKRGALRSVLDKHWVRARDVPPAGPIGIAQDDVPCLSDAQRIAVENIAGDQDGFRTCLLEGVTSSGKTEVYFQTLHHALATGGQALLLVPEIGLTPQLLRRIRSRFPSAPLVAMHSGLGDAERSRAWAAIRCGATQLVVGTRSAVFAPFADLRVIVVDEEHDLSFKQFEGFRYSARDLAIKRAQLNHIPVVLGSATPALESLLHADTGRYTHLKLPQRATRARPPVWTLVDSRAHRSHGGLSQPLVQAMRQRLDRDQQVLLFLNRRGYAPVLICESCGWHARCPHCDANLVLHLQRRKLSCHHCGHAIALPAHCPACGSSAVQALGLGTERLETEICTRFPGVPVVRFDRDVVRGRSAFESRLKMLERPGPTVIVGTQMMAKGHHLPRLALVGVIDIDQALFSCDFRGGERIAQLLVQIAGRAGRSDARGEIIVQTLQPDHPALQAVIHTGYPGFCATALLERKAAGLPPYTAMASLLADAPEADAAQRFCRHARACAPAREGMEILGPAPATMERRAGRSHFRVLCIFQSRRRMQAWLPDWLDALEKLPRGGGVHWTLDVDPLSP